jgi:hypothetical protein
MKNAPGKPEVAHACNVPRRASVRRPYNVISWNMSLPDPVRLFSIICLATVAACGQTIHFRYNPPDGMQSVEVSKRTRIMEMGDDKRIEVTETKALTHVEKRAGGYIINSRFLSLSTERNGRPVANPMADAMRGLEVQFLTDSEGRLREIQGFDKLLDVIRSKFPPAVVKTMAPLFNPDVLINREKAQWEGRISQFVGKSAKIGDVWTGEEDVQLPTGGKANSHSAILFSDLVECRGKQCVRLKLYYNTNAAELGKAVGKIVEDTAKAVSGSSPVVRLSSGIQVEGEGERIVDPETMAIYSEKITRTIRMTADVPGQGRTPMTVRETREYSVEEAGQ